MKKKCGKRRNNSLRGNTSFCHNVFNEKLSAAVVQMHLYVGKCYAIPTFEIIM